jgi:hypothetical protein
MMEMTDFEKAVLTKLLEGDHPVLKLLRRQLQTCRVSTREFTGAGFYANLIVDKSVADRVDCDLRLNDVIGQVNELQHGVGFVLFVNHGTLELLEGYSYDEPWPQKISGFKLSFIGGDKRDWQALVKMLDAKCGAGRAN